MDWQGTLKIIISTYSFIYRANLTNHDAVQLVSKLSKAVDVYTLSVMKRNLEGGILRITEDQARLLQRTGLTQQANMRDQLLETVANHIDQKGWEVVYTAYYAPPATSRR